MFCIESEYMKIWLNYLFGFGFWIWILDLDLHETSLSRFCHAEGEREKKVDGEIYRYIE